jgi:hypothetical protein
LSLSLGSVTISPAGAHGRLEVDVFAARSALSGDGGHGLERLRRVALNPARAGIVRFSIPLDAPARRALRRRGRLALTVRVSAVSPLGRQALSTREVILGRSR